MQQRERMNLRRAAHPLLLALGVLLFILIGCSGQGAAALTPQEVLQNAETMSEKPDFQPNDSLITELYSEEGTYQDAYGTKIEYSWHLPQIADAAKPRGSSTRDLLHTKIKSKVTKGVCRRRSMSFRRSTSGNGIGTEAVCF